MQLSRVIISYLIIWDKLALNGARMVKIALGRENFVFDKVGETSKCVSVLLIYNLSKRQLTHAALLK